MPNFEEVWRALFGTVEIAGQTCVGLVFLLAAVQKMSHWRLLPGVIANYRLLPRWAIAPTAVLLPPVEMLLGIALLLGPSRWFALTGIAILIVFATTMAINVARGRVHIDCGCGQDFLAQHLSGGLVARNVALAALLLPSLPAASSLPLANVLTGAAAGVALFLLYLLFNLFAALPVTGARRFA